MMLQPAFLQVWNEPSFLALLRRAATDAALQALSASAEFALQSDDHKSCDYAPGSLAPVRFRGVAKSAQQSETILLSRVRRLHRLCLQLQRELDHVALRRICLRGLVALAGRIREVHDWHELDGLQTLSDACARLEAEHKCSRFRTWRENNHGNLAEQITWIKRRVKLLAEVSLLAWMFQ